MDTALAYGLRGSRVAATNVTINGAAYVLVLTGNADGVKRSGCFLRNLDATYDAWFEVTYDTTLPTFASPSGIICLAPKEWTWIMFGSPCYIYGANSSGAATTSAVRVQPFNY